jgi:hypothetical protein
LLFFFSFFLKVYLTVCSFDRVVKANPESSLLPRYFSSIDNYLSALFSSGYFSDTFNEEFVYNILFPSMSFLNVTELAEEKNTNTTEQQQQTTKSLVEQNIREENLGFTNPVRFYGLKKNYMNLPCCQRLATLLSPGNSLFNHFFNMKRADPIELSVTDAIPTETGPVSEKKTTEITETPSGLEDNNPTVQSSSIPLEKGKQSQELRLQQQHLQHQDNQKEFFYKLLSYFLLYQQQQQQVFGEKANLPGGGQRFYEETLKVLEANPFLLEKRQFSSSAKTEGTENLYRFQLVQLLLTLFKPSATATVKNRLFLQFFFHNPYRTVLLSSNPKQHPIWWNPLYDQSSVKQMTDKELAAYVNCLVQILRESREQMQDGSPNLVNLVIYPGKVNDFSAQQRDLQYQLNITSRQAQQQYHQQQQQGRKPQPLPPLQLHVNIPRSVFMHEIFQRYSATPTLWSLKSFSQLVHLTKLADYSWYHFPGPTAKKLNENLISIFRQLNARPENNDEEEVNLQDEYEVVQVIIQSLELNNMEAFHRESVLYKESVVYLLNYFRKLISSSSSSSSSSSADNNDNEDGGYQYHWKISDLHFLLRFISLSETLEKDAELKLEFLTPPSASPGDITQWQMNKVRNIFGEKFFLSDPAIFPAEEFNSTELLVMEKNYFQTMVKHCSKEINYLMEYFDRLLPILGEKSSSSSSSSASSKNTNHVISSSSFPAHPHYPSHNSITDMKKIAQAESTFLLLLPYYMKTFLKNKFDLRPGEGNFNPNVMNYFQNEIFHPVLQLIEQLLTILKESAAQSTFVPSTNNKNFASTYVEKKRPWNQDIPATFYWKLSTLFSSLHSWDMHFSSFSKSFQNLIWEMFVCYRSYEELTHNLTTTQRQTMKLPNNYPSSPPKTTVSTTESLAASTTRADSAVAYHYSVPQSKYIRTIMNDQFYFFLQFLVNNNRQERRKQVESVSEALQELKRERMIHQKRLRNEEIEEHPSTEDDDEETSESWFSKNYHLKRLQLLAKEHTIPEDYYEADEFDYDRDVYLPKKRQLIKEGYQPTLTLWKDLPLFIRENILFNVISLLKELDQQLPILENKSTNNNSLSETSAHNPSKRRNLTATMLEVKAMEEKLELEMNNTSIDLATGQPVASNNNGTTTAVSNNATAAELLLVHHYKNASQVLFYWQVLRSFEFPTQSDNDSTSIPFHDSKIQLTVSHKEVMHQIDMMAKQMEIIEREVMARAPPEKWAWKKSTYARATPLEEEKQLFRGFLKEYGITIAPVEQVRPPRPKRDQQQQH